MADYALVSAEDKLWELLDSQSDIPIREIELLYVDLQYFESFLSNMRGNKVRSIVLDQEIEDVADKIEDWIAFDFSSFEKLVEVVQDITILKDKLKKGEYKTDVDLPPAHYLAADDELLFGRYDSILGSCPDPVKLEGKTLFLSYQVLRGTSKLKIIVVHGMAGCGKTTLVKHAYERLADSFAIHHMVTIGLNFTLRQILVCVLTALGFNFDDGTNEMLGEFELGMSLKNRLRGKCFFLVLDNLWDSTTWNQLKEFFPDEHNGSRIICVSRDGMVNNGTMVKMEFFCPKLLDNDISWELLYDLISSIKEFNNPKFEEIGKEIAKKCEGLPLAIISMGKLLRESEKTIERWKSILEDDDPFQIKRSNGQPISKSLYLSYDSLPYYLKSCFLYMGILPQNHQIKRSGIRLLWIAEGLISYNEDEHIEYTALRYFLELQYKNMSLYNHPRESNLIRIHCVFRSLCIRQAQDDQFCLVIKKYVKTFSHNTNRLCFHNNTVLGFKEMHKSMESLPHLSTILCCGPQHRYPLRVCFNFKYLKRLHILSIRFYEFPLEVLELFRLRYLAITYDGELPPTISKLWKLEFLILGKYHYIKASNGPSYLPKEIWGLKCLRHLHCVGLDLQDPNYSDAAFEYLFTLSGVGAHSCTPNILSRMPNLKKLKVCLVLKEDEVESFSFFDVVDQYLDCLESFKCVVHQVFSNHVIPPIPVFPINISKLSLSGCGFPWKYTSVIGLLPYLTALTLQSYAFCGPVWEVVEAGFPRLETLIMEDLDIEEWIVKSHQFPKLSFLLISHCYNLQEAPIELGDLPNFRLMELYSINASFGKSLRHMQERRLLLEDDMLEIAISKLGGTKLFRCFPSELCDSEDDHDDLISMELEDEAKKS